MKREIKFAAMLLLAVLSTANANNNYNVVAPQQTPQTKKPKLVVLVYDISASVDGYAFLKEQDFAKLYDALSFNGGGCIVALKIQANSTQQEILTGKIDPCDTIVINKNVNIYQKNRILHENRKIIQASETQKAAFVKKFRSILVPKQDCQTDLKTALDLGANTLQSPLYAGYDRFVIVISDLKETVTKKKPYTVDFGHATCILVRATEAEVSRVNASKIIKSNTIEEAIEIININKY